MGRKKKNKSPEIQIPRQPKKIKSQAPPKKEINPNAEYRDQLVKIYVSKTELEQIKDYIVIHTKTGSLSKFIRNSIIQKINGFDTIGLNPAVSIDLTGIQENLNLLMGKVIELTKINTLMLEAKQNFPSCYDKKKFRNIEQEIIQVIREFPQYISHGTPVPLLEIMKVTDLDPDVIFDTIINSDKFRQKGRGWVLND
ncbi:MAG: hypothetical protein ACTSR8_15010 [Promethearchaeota archaeon]